jgi:hypothetical protein
MEAKDTIGTITGMAEKSCGNPIVTVSQDPDAMPHDGWPDGQHLQRLRHPQPMTLAG